MILLCVSSILASLAALTTGELLQNAGFESLSHWDCWNSHCSLSTDRHSGQHSLKITDRSKSSDGPSQYLQVSGGQVYRAEVWVKLLTDRDHSGQNVELMNNYEFTDGSGEYQVVARHSNARTSDGWIHLQGAFTTPTNKAIRRLRLYIQSGPAGSVDFLVDSASVTPAGGSSVATHTAVELLQNAEFESLSHWDCWNSHCSLSTDRHSGQHSLKITDRSKSSDGPSQYLQVSGGHVYRAEVWVKLLNDHSGQKVELMNNYEFTDGSGEYQVVARHSNAKTSDGWIHLQGAFTTPTHKAIKRMRLFIQSGPEGSVSFLVDSASVKSASGSGGHVTFADLNHVIDQQRKSNIVLQVTTANGINKADVKIQVLQKKKSFPFGTAANSWKYNANAAGGKYRDFIHTHFNWAIPESALKWKIIEPQRGHKDYQLALKMIHGLKSHGLKVRASNLLWSIPSWVPDWVKALSGNELRSVVKQHIEETMNKTRGLLEHWEVNNENLHGTWYQDRLHDPDYDLELFNITHHADPHVKLFLNDYEVVASGTETSDYLIQANRFKGAGVGLSGLGVQCHFGDEKAPDPTVIKQRLDILAQAGLPIWVTELDVVASDESRRADFYEAALRALYGHPAVEGILFWGFWDQAHWRGEKAALVKGDNLQMTGAGRRVFDLLENQWMTDETHSLPHSGNHMTVRGFHGDYEVHVIYNGKELSNLRQTFTLGKGPHTVNINVHT